MYLWMASVPVLTRERIRATDHEAVVEVSSLVSVLCYCNTAVVRENMSFWNIR